MHITSGNVYSSQIGSPGWTQAAIINSISHFGVPIFVMISGALFLHPDREIDLRKLWTHNILRMSVIFILWCFIYGFADHLTYRGGFKELMWSSVIARNHLWFLPMIIGIYIITPVLARWVRNAPVKEIHVFILSFLVFQIVCETVNAFGFAQIISKALEYRNIELVCSYVGYFVIGYYIAHVGIPAAFKKFVYILGLLGIMGSITLVLVSSGHRGVPMLGYVDSFSSFTFFYSTALFTFVYEKAGKKENSGRAYVFLSNVAKDTLGLYLCHILIIERFDLLGKLYSEMPVIPGILFMTAAVTAIGIAGSALLRRIPFAGRYIC